jgi:hypothetical protein
MSYIKVKWIHSFPDEPILLYSELDDKRWEARKVEVFADERMGYAGAGARLGGTKLGKEPLPSLAEIAADPQFEPVEISKAEFETVWARALSRT